LGKSYEPNKRKNIGKGWEKKVVLEQRRALKRELGDVRLADTGAASTAEMQRREKRLPGKKKKK